ncbi:hypothetical protein ACW2AB_00145 [Limosilactobacillus fermentum]
MATSWRILVATRLSSATRVGAVKKPTWSVGAGNLSGRAKRASASIHSSTPTKASLTRRWFG